MRTSPFQGRLEERARRIAEAPGGEAQWDPSPVSALRRKIAALLAHLDRTRAVHEDSRQQLDDASRTIGTMILRLSPHESRQREYAIDGKEKLLNKRLYERLKSSQLRLREQGQKLAITEHERLQTLEDRLLDLIEKYTVLRGIGSEDPDRSP